MPLGAAHTHWATFGAIDLRTGSFELFRQEGAGSGVVIPAFTPDASEGYQPGVYSDPIEAIGGRGVPVGADPQSQIQLAISNVSGPVVAAQFTYYLGTDDRWRFANSGAGSVTLSGADLRLWGWAADSITVGATETIVAPEDWQRGQVIGSSGGAAGFTVVTFPDPVTLHGWVDDLSTASRQRGELGDRDDRHALDCIEALDNAVNDSVDERIRWSVDADFRICRTAPAANDAALVWADTEGRDALGFAGDEQPEIIDGLAVIRATYPPLHNVGPSRPLVDLDPWSEVTHFEYESAGPARWRSVDGIVRGWDLMGRLDGQMDQVHNALHATNVALPDASALPMTLYLGWPERRRMLPRPYRPNVDQPRYDLQYTGEIAEVGGAVQHYRGRLHVWLLDERIRHRHDGTPRHRPRVELSFAEADDDF